MKNKLYLLILLMLAASVSQGQNIVLEFNANHTCTQINLDSIRIENLSQGDKMTLHYPDNIAVFVITNIGDFDTEQDHLFVSQNYPNPFSALTYIDVYLAMPDMVSLNVYDLKGRTIARREDKLEEGMHRFSFSAGAETTYILNVTSGKHVEKRIMLQMGTTGSAVSEISYLGASVGDFLKSAPKSSDFNFTPGDDLRFTGFVTDIDGNMDYGVIDDAPEASTEYLFDIANKPPDLPSEISGEIDVPEYATGLVYEVDEIAGLTYLWSVPDGWEITQGQGSHAITVDAGSVAGNISVKSENSCGTGEERILTVDVYVVDGVVDIDGNVYKTVFIGYQEWMAENLRVTRDADGNSINRLCYNHDEANCELYGGLYTWHTVMNGQSSSNSNPSGVQGICPTGWHVPSDAEWTELLDYLDLVGFPNSSIANGAGNALKSCRQVDSPLGSDCDTTEHPRWNSHNTHFGFDEFGFSALPGGYRYPNLHFSQLGTNGYWWSSTESSSEAAWYQNMRNNFGGVSGLFTTSKSSGHSLRCVRQNANPTSFFLNLQVSPAGSGNVTGAGVYEVGEEVSITAVPNDNWNFAYWTGDTEYLDDVNTANAILTMPAYNVTVKANFVAEVDGVTDIDGNEYITIIIGNQEWMAENLRVTKYNNGDTITTDLSDLEWENTIDGAYAVYPNSSIDGLDSDAEVISAYGKLYNWLAVDDPRGLCPAGWSVPTEADWTQLITYIVGVGFPNIVGNALKSCRQVGSPLEECNTTEHPRWNSHSTHFGFDEFGFSALPGGNRNSSGSFFNVGGTNFLWLADEFNDTHGMYIFKRNLQGSVSQGFSNKRTGFSVRCFRDITEPTLYNLQLEVYPDNSGSVTGAGEYEEGTQVNITASAITGWEFVEWTGDTDYIDNTSSANTTLTMPAENISLTANFQIVYPIYGDGLIDIDGNEYLTVIIGNREWMAENLRVTKYNNGDTIFTGLSDTEWQNTTDGAYTIYPYSGGDWPDEPVEGINSDEEMVTAYGKLYNWFAVDDASGLCPAGWSVPSDDDWAQLVNYVVAQGYPNESDNPIGAGNALKSCRQVDSSLGGECDTSDHPRWNNHGIHKGLDAFGFSALPAGLRWFEVGFFDIGSICGWWSSTEGSSDYTWSRNMYTSGGGVSRASTSKRVGFSVRCVKDIE